MASYLKNRFAIFQQKAFRRYFIGSTCATLGMGAAYIITTWLIISISNNISTMICSFLAYWLPNAVFSPLAGVIIDRVDRKKLIGFGDICCGLMYALLGLIIFFHSNNTHTKNINTQNIHISYIYFTWFIIGVLQSFYVPALMAFIREVVSKKDLLYANVNIDLGYQLGYLTGVSLAGFLISLFGITISYLIAGSLIVISGAAILTVKRDFISDKNINKNINKEPLIKQTISDFKKGLFYLFSNKNILILYSSQLFFVLIFMTAPILMAPFAKNILHTGSKGFGQIEGALMLGCLLGGFLLSYLAEKISFTKIIFIASTILSISLIKFSFTQNLSNAIISYFFVGISLGIWALMMTKAQEATDLDYQGRVQSVFNSLMAFALVILYLIIHLASGTIDLRHLFWIISGLALIPMILSLIYPKCFLSKLDNQNQT